MSETLIVGHPETTTQMKKRYKENRKLIEAGRSKEIKKAPTYSYTACKGGYFHGWKSK